MHLKVLLGDEGQVELYSVRLEIMLILTQDSAWFAQNKSYSHK
jgi:hypothetical protein